MSHGGRSTAGVLATLLLFAAGCGAKSGTPSPPAAGPATTAKAAAKPDGPCVVGDWHQNLGSRTIEVEGGGGKLTLNLAGGGRTLHLKADGTGTWEWTQTGVYEGSNATTKLRAEYTGSGALVYKAVDDAWEMAEDNTKQIITLTLNGNREMTGRAGTKGTTPVKGTYRCAGDTLVLRTDDVHHIYDRV